MQTTKIQLLEDARQAHTNGNLAQALELLQEYLNQNSPGHEAFMLQGDIYLELGNYYQAEQSYQQALAMRPGLAEIYFKLGVCLESSNKNQAALDQFQTALNLSPENQTYQGKLGELLYKLGLERSNVNYLSEGITLMEQCHAAGESSISLRDSLAHAYLARASSTWVPDPEVQGQLLATSLDQVLAAEKELARAQELLDPGNIALNTRAQEMEQQLLQVKKKKYFGISKYLKVPIVFGLLFLFFGSSVQSFLSFLMAGLYFVANRKPGYVQNSHYVQNKMRTPIALRIMDQVNAILSQFSIFGSIGNVLLITSLIRFFTRLLGACFVMITLPYEIVRSFVTNYSYNEVIEQLQRLKSAITPQKKA